MAAATTKYTFEATSTTTTTYELRDDGHTNKHHPRKHHRRGTSKDSDNDETDPTDGSGSLTYSAASSINSAGESTDSSFADIMRVLDVQDSKELANYLKKETSARSLLKDESSLAYTVSTDAESHGRSLGTEDLSRLHGAEIISTLTGQQSDQNGYDGGNYPVVSSNNDRDDPSGDSFGTPDSGNILFSQAEHEDSLRLRKNKKRQARKDGSNSKRNANGGGGGSGSSAGGMSSAADKNVVTPRTKNRGDAGRKLQLSPVGGISRGAGGGATPHEPRQQQQQQQQGSPQSSSLRPPKAAQTIEMQEEDDVWYAKWWMFCFPDAVKDMTPPKR